MTMHPADMPANTPSSNDPNVDTFREETWDGLVEDAKERHYDRLASSRDAWKEALEQAAEDTDQLAMIADLLAGFFHGICSEARSTTTINLFVREAAQTVGPEIKKILLDKARSEAIKEIGDFATWSRRLDDPEA